LKHALQHDASWPAFVQQAHRFKQQVSLSDLAALQPELRDRADRGRTLDEIAAQYGLLPEDVAMVLYAFRVRCTARV